MIGGSNGFTTPIVNDIKNLLTNGTYGLQSIKSAIDNGTTGGEISGSSSKTINLNMFDYDY